MHYIQQPKMNECTWLQNLKNLLGKLEMQSAIDFKSVKSSSSTLLKNKKSNSHANHVQVKESSDRIVDPKVSQDLQDLEILKSFDLNLKYGPNLGLSRLERYQRALDLELNPPLEIKEILQRLPSTPKYQESLWY